MKKQLEKVDHDYIRYANCWEDADVLVEGLKIVSGDKVLSIGSAGDNSFSLLCGDPELVLAVDINAVQLQLIELKKAAFLAFDHAEFLAFLGFRESKGRLELYEKVKEHLSESQLTFWNERLTELDNGIIYAGKFERYFKLFRTRLLPLIHSKKTIDELFEAKTSEQQKQFYTKKWNNWRWKLLFKIFFSKFVMGVFGRDPAFLKEVEVPVGTFIFGQAERHLSSVNCQRNYFLHFILKGTFGESLPHYARKENFESIKKNCHNLKTFTGFAEDAFKEHTNFTKFNLSNIFEYMNKEQFEAVAQNLIDNATKYSHFAYWNLMVPRRLQDVDIRLTLETEKSKELSEKDNGFFYLGVFFNTKK